MPDIIQLLPDAVANQIAAGEVVQRPASAVKELMENSIDAGATEIKLIVKNAGKTLIQVIDNGIGMTETDARLSLERHATSKIKKAEDLFALTTMGFRGEAIPSIAAISQMEIKSKQHDQDLGTHIVLEGSKVLSQEVCQCPSGTNISIKNLFFNVPARRNFLKSNPVETRHIIEEFQRVAMIHPEVSFSMVHDQNEVFQLSTGNFRQRIVGIFGSKYDQRLVPVEEETDIVSIKGFIGKPEFAKKTRGEQYFFVNQRFIKSGYLNHAIQVAYEELLPKDQYPSYFLKLEVDPSKIDINIHPTKTEVKFEEERAIYAIIRTAVRQALGKFNIAPSLDFERESSFDVPLLKKGEAIRVPEIKVNPDFNPFTESNSRTYSSSSSGFPSERSREKVDPTWENLFEKDPVEGTISSKANTSIPFEEETVLEEKKLIQLHRKYILNHIKSGFIIVDQQRAHERILFDRLQLQLQNGKGSSQQLLFPEDIQLSTEDSIVLNSLLEEMNQLGFDIRPFGKEYFIIHGVPTGVEDSSVRSLIEQLLEEFKSNLSELKDHKREKLIRSMARSMSIKKGKQLSEKEMEQLIDELFACEMPYHLPDGKLIVMNYSLEDLDKQFKRK
jgi:DNA mismatch repair protein MutL